MATRLGEIVSGVYNLGSIHKNKEGICVLHIDKKNVHKVKPEHLFPCYLKDFNTKRKDGSRRITLGFEMGDGASRVVYQHPTNRGLVIKVDKYSYHDKKCPTSTIHNQNQQEFESYQEFVKSGNKGLLSLLAPVQKATANYFMITQKRINGVQACDYYHGSRDPASFARDKFATESRKEYGHRFGINGLDFHDANIMVNRKGQPKIVDLGFIQKVPPRVIEQEVDPLREALKAAIEARKKNPVQYGLRIQGAKVVFGNGIVV